MFVLKDIEKIGSKKGINSMLIKEILQVRACMLAFTWKVGTFYKHIHVHKHWRVHAHAHTHTYTYTHMHLQTHTHTYTQQAFEAIASIQTSTTMLHSLVVSIWMLGLHTMCLAWPSFCLLFPESGGWQLSSPGEDRHFQLLLVSFKHEHRFVSLQVMVCTFLTA